MLTEGAWEVVALEDALAVPRAAHFPAPRIPRERYGWRRGRGCALAKLDGNDVRRHRTAVPVDGYGYRPADDGGIHQPLHVIHPSDVLRVDRDDDVFGAQSTPSRRAARH